MWPFRKQAAPVTAPTPPPRSGTVAVSITPQPLVVSTGQNDYGHAWQRLLSIAGHVAIASVRDEAKWAAEHWPEATHHLGHIGMEIPKFPPQKMAEEKERLKAIVARLRHLGWTPTGMTEDE